MHRITFLDAATIGDTPLDSLTQFGELETHATTSSDETAARLQETNIAITNKVVINAEIIAACNKLKLICVAATGTNCVDLDAAKEAGIPVCNVAGYSTAGVKQHTIGFLINLSTNMHRLVSEPEKWAESSIFTRLDYPITDLAGKTLGIVGLGTIGKSVAKAAQGLGMDVVALARQGSDDCICPRLPRKQFFSECDAISLHCPLTSETYGMINEETLGMMKSSAFLINTGRGQLVNEEDLAAALKNGNIAGAGLDVLCMEPPSDDHVLLDPEIPNLIITPHTAWASTESRTRLIDGVVKNIDAFLKGEDRNLVN
ncbi:MAG: D-2-hydroxyacid dehydrogenase [Akkermansiaceae bacterium]